MNAPSDTAAASTDVRDSRALATRQEVADWLGMREATLSQWAWMGKGPRYRIVGRHSRYRWSDVEAWLDEQPTTRASDKAS